MRKARTGFSYVGILITLAIVAWLTVMLLRLKDTPNQINEVLKENGVAPLTEQPATPESAAKAVESAVKELQKRGEDRDKKAMESLDQ